MKKNYFKCFFKSYGIVPTLMFVLLFVALGFVTVVSPGLINKTFTSMIKGVLLVALGGFALIGFTNLKSEKFSLLDFIRGIATVGTLAVLVMLLAKSSLGKMFMVIAALSVVFIVQLIFRIKFVYDDCEESTFKNYFGAIAGTYNPLLILICGVVLAVGASLLLDAGLAIANYKNLIIGAAVGLVVISLIPAIDKDTEVTLVDFLLAVAFVTTCYMLVLSMNDLASTTGKLVLLGIGVSIAGLIARGVLYNKPRGYDNPAHKIRTYFKQVYDTFDVTISLGLGVVILGLFACPFAAAHGSNSIASVLRRVGLTDLTVICVIAIIAVVALLALTFIFRKFTSIKVEKVDGLLVSMLFASTFVIPYAIFVFIGKAVSFETITANPLLLVVFIAFVLLFLVSAAIQFIRFRNFDPLLSLVGDKRYVQDEEDETLEEEVEEDASEVEEAPYDPFALTEEDEALYQSVYGIEEEAKEEPEVVEEVVEEEVVEETEEVYEEVVEEAPTLDAQEEPALDADEADDADDEAEDDDEEEDAEEFEEEDAEETEEVLVQPREAGVIVQDFQIVDEDGAPKKIKRKFNSKMMFAPYETKEYYNEIKNYLMCYRAKGRYSARCESFRYKGLVAKVALGGKSIKVFLALDPEFVEQYPKYHLKNVSDKKQYAEVPVMIKVRSPRGLKYFKELVDIMMAQRMVKPKRNYQPTNFIAQLIPNGEAILATLGMSTDYLHNLMNVRSIPEDMPDDLIDYIPMIPGDDLEEEEVEANVYLDTLCNHFEDGDEITIDVLKSLHIVTRGNVLRIKARGTLDRKLIIYAEKFDEDALKMLMCTNCTAVRIIRDFEE